MQRGRDDDGAGLGEEGDEQEGVMGRGRWDRVCRADMTGGRGGYRDNGAGWRAVRQWIAVWGGGAET